MEVFYLLLLGIYTWLLWSMKRDWVEGGNAFSHGIAAATTAVLIPFRNESKSLPKLLLNLEKTTASCQEVVLINDHSDDDSRTIVASFIRERNHPQWILLDSPGAGKKAALTAGVEHVKSEIILTTDADCFLPAGWPSNMAKAFASEGVQLVAGPVLTLSMPGFLAKFQQIEWASLLLVSNSLFSGNTPLMCSGANLAYRRSAFLDVEGYQGNDRCLSGDDEFLLEKIVRTYGADSVAYLKEEELLVKTHPSATWQEFLQQRTRWTGKRRAHRSYQHLSAATVAYMIGLLQLSTVILVLDATEGLVVFIVFWTVKAGVDRNVLKTVLADYRIYPGILQMTFTSILHPFYVVLVGFFALFGKYTWKGRNNRFKS